MSLVNTEPVELSIPFPAASSDLGRSHCQGDPALTDTAARQHPGRGAHGDRDARELGKVLPSAPQHAPQQGCPTAPCDN